MKFSYAQIEEIINEMQSILDKMHESLTNIKDINNKIESSGCWSGNASNYYRRKFSDVTFQFEDVRLNILKSIYYLKEVADDYNELDKQIIRSVANKLNISR